MGRGKDGYDALLVKSEGGQAEEIVSEENGVLISTILRQYFMSLKVLGRWKSWSNSMHRHFDKVQKEVHARHPVIDGASRGTSPIASNGSLIPPRPPNGRRISIIATPSKYPHRKDAQDTPFDPEEDEHVDDVEVQPLGSYDEDERQLEIMRKVMRKWKRLAGIKNDTAVCDGMDESEFMVNWTKVSRSMNARIL